MTKCSEVTSFAVISDKKNNMKYPLADYELTPNIAIIDPQFVMSLPKSATADTGLDVLTHALEAYVSVMAPIYYEMPINDKLFIAQADVIKEVAKRGSCVIVGRCADYVLENENVDVLSVFVYGSVDYRAKRVMSALDITQAKAKDKVLKTDKQRRTYYDYYTSKNWGVMSNYDLCIDAEKFGIEETANMIINAAKKKIK